MNLSLSVLASPPVAEAGIEMVERKGTGHPDTLCDALAEQLSLSLSHFYLDRFGVILHHNVDKALLWGGAARPHFGGGEVTEPIELYLCGRATLEHRGVRVPLEELAVEGTREWLRAHLRHLDPIRHVRVHALVRPSSRELTELFARAAPGTMPLANDTSMGCGFAPLDALEQAVLRAERQLNAIEIQHLYPEIGEDIKVLGVRREGQCALTVACAFVAQHVSGLDDYFAKKARVRALVEEAVGPIAGVVPAVQVNTADGDTEGNIYLTVTGTSAEAGDDGQVGRGNRVNGLITPNRPMSLEAVAGKNPVSHVGKIYSVTATRIAEQLVAELPEIEEAYCWMASRIGVRIDEPQAIDVRVRLRPGAAMPQQRIRAIVGARLAGLGEFWREWLASDGRVY